MDKDYYPQEIRFRISPFEKLSLSTSFITLLTLDSPASIYFEKNNISTLHGGNRMFLEACGMAHMLTKSR